MFLEGFHQGGSCPSRSRCPSRCSWTTIGCCGASCCLKSNLLFLVTCPQLEGSKRFEQRAAAKQEGVLRWGDKFIFALEQDKNANQMLKLFSNRAQESEREAHKFKAKEASVLRSTPFAPILPQQRLTVPQSISPLISFSSTFVLKKCFIQTSISSPCFPLQGLGSSCAGSRPEHW